MSNRIVILSGFIASGKSTLAEALSKKLRLYHLRTRQALIEAAQAHGDKVDPFDRQALIDYGHSLDIRTNHNWLANKVAQASMRNPTGVVVDSIRKVEQVEAIRRFSGMNIIHIHLDVNPKETERRHMQREGKTHPGFAHEATAMYGLQDEADLVIQGDRMSVDDEVRIALGFMGYRPPTTGYVDAIVGGQYGSEGKGHVVSYIANEYDMMIRVGGPNAGHTVLDPFQDRKFSFYHIPSGALHMTGPLVLGPGANIRIPVLKKEIEESGVDASRIHIDPQANIITDDDLIRENGLVSGIGSTGQGVGAATSDRIMGRSNNRSEYLAGSGPSRDCLNLLGVRITRTQDILEDGLRSGARVLLEGTQGTGLSLYHGAYPYVTSRDTTVSGTMAEAGIAPSLIRKVYMVCRTNPIRVQSPKEGTSGPMGQETTWEEISKRAGLPAELLREKETTTTTKRQRRVAEFDWSLLYQSTLLNRPTDIALTFVDYISSKNQRARQYEQLTADTHRFIDRIEMVTGARVSLITTRFHRRSIVDRRLGGGQ